MSFDSSRFTFNSRNDYSGVVMQQGRVQLDSDWNEWLAEFARRIQAGTLDILGRAVYPSTTPHAFEITAQSNKLLIGPGRMYVDGLLAENHGDPAAAQWDSALAEMSGAPQPPLASAQTGAIDYTQQPYMPPNTALPTGNGPFLAYLDVWVRPVDYINDPNLIDAAVGVDSTGRLQTVWQVRLMNLSDSPGATCDSPISGWPPPASAGLLTTGTTPTTPSGPCCLASGAAYTGLENQFYRVEIHQPGTPEGSAVPPTNLASGIATFKWSRDNGSVITAVSSIANATNSAGDPASQLTVQSLGRDQVLGFAPGNWIEILDDATEFGQTHGELHQIDTIDFAAKTITLATTLGAGFPSGDTDPTRHTRIRRWDQSGKVYEQDGTTVWWDIDAQGSGEIPVPPAGISLILENGITVSFDVSTAGGGFNTGDFWSFAARTATGQVEKLDEAAPRGIHHHYARLAIVTFPSTATDCRTKWPPDSGDECGCCCTYTVGDGVNSFGKYTSINEAINALPDLGGEVCILPGRYFENVVIRGRRDIVLRGCGWQTRIASASLRPAPPPTFGIAANGEISNAAPAKSFATALTGGVLSHFDAVITIAQSQHVKLLSFAIEAAEDEVGVLIDGTGKLSADGTDDANDVQTHDELRSLILLPPRTVDVTVEDLVITASLLPGILADAVALLQIENNRIAMENVLSAWPAVWVRGKEIRVLRNWVGLRSREWLPDTVLQDLASDSDQGGSEFGLSRKVPLHPGGILVAGPSLDVFVEDNEIDGAGRNGITLGSLTILNSDGHPTGGIPGGTVQVPGPCDTTLTLQVPGEGTVGGLGGGRIVASGKLLNIQINRNRIRNTGLCGIGPIGFFNLIEELEVISVENLTIAGNTISSTVQGELEPPRDGFSLFAYAAICVPDVVDLKIHDNNVTDFGLRPGDPVCGMFVLHGEMVEISRNHVLETRDWSSEQGQQQATGLGGGIVLLLVTPPTFTTMQSFSDSDVTVESLSRVYLPNVPALRIEHNVVRVALGNALDALGLGCFSIVNNHLATGGTVVTKQRSIATTVLILNLSTSIESAGVGKYSDLGQDKYQSSNLENRSANPSCGAVLFTNNICQLEARLSRQRGAASVAILALDDLIFSNNECWVDGPRLSAVVDALLAAGSLQVTSNRFQEAAGFPVLASGFTLGALNITSQNISTYCLFAGGILQPAIANNNLTLVPAQLCDAAAEKMGLRFTK